MQILHRPFSDKHYPIGATDRAPELLERVLAAFPHATASDIDFEYWAENALMMIALEDQARSLEIPFTLLEAGPRHHYSGTATLTPRQDPAAPATVMWGLFIQKDAFSFPVPANLVWNHGEAVDTITGWPSSPTFLKHAGRSVELLDMDMDAIRAAFAEMRGRGETHAFLKTREKSWAQIIDLAEGIPEDLAWDIVANEGRKNALILQSVIQPRNEYRVFVVGDTIVTGAGCIEAFTPLDALPGVAFDERVEHVRSQSPLRVDADLVAAYVTFAEQFAREWAHAISGEHAYTLDLCIDETTGAILPVELNPMTNTGLFCANPSLLAQALVAALH